MTAADLPVAHGPLAGILVADFSRILAGPLATMMLADLGARVIKVERPVTGDDTRSWGPPHSATGSTYFDSVNRNKESVCLDLADPADRDLARTLIARADVVVENFAPGGMDKLGLGYDEAMTSNPGVVYASISGFGSAGGRDLLGYDVIVQALGGLMSITGETHGPALKTGVAIVDVLTAKDAVAGVLAALLQRQTTGRGALLEVNLLSSLQGALANQAQAFLGAGVVPGRLGNAHPSIAPYESLECADGQIVVACGNDAQFRRLVAVLGSPQLSDDPRFMVNALRVTNRAVLVPLLEQQLRHQDSAEWQRRLTAAGVPAGRVGTIADGIALADSLGLEPIIEVFDSTGVAVATQVRHPITWNPPITRPNSAPPLLGQQDAQLRDWLAH
ncbi:CoA transferase [Salinibacterium sp.]|uniref:CaiB/BaiF CoA transferase family protein n=2 Tax=Salinibacterium sp. TaxID=1915057 RepID=UPI00286B3891|nr:CoA transferase [Salinibacterium sp.]